MTNNTDDTRDVAMKELMGVGHELAQDFLSDKQFSKRFQHTAKHARQQFESESSLNHMMYCHLLNRTTKVWQIVALSLNGMPEGRDRYYFCGRLGARIKRDFPDHMLVLVTHVSEGWGAPDSGMSKRDDPRYLPKGQPMPRNNPKKWECIVAAAMTIDMRQSYGTWEVIRDNQGNFKKWGKRGGVSEYAPGSTATDPKKSGDFLVTALFSGYAIEKLKERTEEQ